MLPLMALFEVHIVVPRLSTSISSRLCVMKS